jgi:DNA-binding CsgD family transcriptional regulator/tetratricopeptide (TPR) repeat protein
VLVTERQGEVHYCFLETIRQYAAERLRASAEAAQMQNRHQAYFLSLAEKAESQLIGAEQLHWLDLLNREHANLRAALQWALESEQIETGVRLAAALIEFWPPRGYVHEGKTWFEKFLAQPALLGRTPARAAALWGAGCYAEYLGDSVTSVARLEESTAIWREIGDERGLARALRDLGYTLLQQHNHAVAQLRLEESVVLFRKSGDRTGLAVALRFLGNLPDVAYATRCLEESLALFRELKYPSGIGKALLGLGERAAEQGEFGAAKAYVEESLALRGSVKEEFGVAVATRLLGSVAVLQGNYERATDYYRQARDLFAALGHRSFVAGTLNAMGQVAFFQGDKPRALTLMKQGLSIHHELARLPGIIHDLVGLAGCAVEQKQLPSAVRLLAAVSALIKSADVKLNAVERKIYDHALGDVRTRLDACSFVKCWEEGGQWTLEQAIAAAQRVTANESSPASEPASLPAWPADLTTREVDVLRLLAQGLTDAQIAETLVISPRTVNGHLRSIYSKLDVTNRTAAARYAAEFKLR